MELNTVNGVLRAVLPSVFAYAVAKGWLSTSQVADVTAAIITLVAAAWSIQSNWKKS